MVIYFFLYNHFDSFEYYFSVSKDMLDQVIKQHDDVPYFHIGCDEVYYKLLHPKCREVGKTDFTNVFMR
jgi:hypothetical protein